MSTTTVEELGENRVRPTVDVLSDQVQHAVEHALSDLSERQDRASAREDPAARPRLPIGKDRIYAEAVESHIGGWF